MLILTNRTAVKSDALVESRNYPYLTAEGYFQLPDIDYDWVFSASPDGYSTLVINMKLFDLRFGETVIIYPQKDRSFYYDQIALDSVEHGSIEDLKHELLSSRKITEKISSQAVIDSY